MDFVITSEQYKTGGSNWFPDSNDKAAAVNLKNAQLDNPGQREPGFRWIAAKGRRIYTCYWSPNTTFLDYLDFLRRLELSVRSSASPVIIAGDFNAWHTTWGSKQNNRRGDALYDLIASLGLVLLNEENTPTFESNARTSIVDLTLISAELKQSTVAWTVMDAESLSDHKYILFEIKDDDQGRKAKQPITTKIKLDYKLLDETLKSPPQWVLREGDLEDNAIALSAKIFDICGKKYQPTGKNKTSVHWWSPELNTLWGNATQSRRKLKRKLRRSNSSACQQELENLRKDRKELSRAIKKSKEAAWKRLCDQVDREPWGMPYKLVMGKLLARTISPGLNSEDKVRNIVQSLFPDHQQRRVLHWPLNQAEPIGITHEELVAASRSLKTKIAPGIDGITNEAIKILVERQPRALVAIYNQCLAERRFPEVWKKARLILLKKGDKPEDDPSSYHPICLLDCPGKLLQKILDNRLRIHLEEPEGEEEGLSENQYGFRAGRSTTDAVEAVCRAAEDSSSRNKVGIVMIDIKNAFNSAPWGKIIEAVVEKNVPQYLGQIIDSYLS